MDFINNKNVKAFATVTIVIVAIFIVSPLFIFGIYFSKKGISNRAGDWADFATYFGGVVGTLLNFLAVCFSLVSIYITLKIASKVHDAEIRFNTENSKREIELTHKQNRPYAYIDIIKNHDLTKITLQNFGSGPMIVKSIEIKDGNSKSYLHFKDFLSSNIHEHQDATFIFNTAPTHILVPGTSKDLLTIHPRDYKTKFTELQYRCRNLLAETTLIIQYEDIFENPFEHRQPLMFLRD